MRVLLLNGDYSPINFISERRAIKLLVKDKVDILSTWNHTINWISGSFKLPAIIKLKEFVRLGFYQVAFSRQALIKRDNSACQYCLKFLTISQITIDHVIPKSRNGKSSFLNCVVACKDCNSKKAAKTPEEAGMKLIKAPMHLKQKVYLKLDMEEIHPEWRAYLNT